MRTLSSSGVGLGISTGESGHSVLQQELLVRNHPRAISGAHFYPACYYNVARFTAASVLDTPEKRSFNDLQVTPFDWDKRVESRYMRENAIANSLQA